MSSSMIGAPEPMVWLQRPQVARMSERAFAAMIDFEVAFPTFFLTIGLAAYRYGVPKTAPGKIELHGEPALYSFGIDLIIWLVYFIACEWAFGKTPGKGAMGIEVRDCKGGQATFGQILGRNLLRPIDAFFFYILGFIVALASPQNQRIGDRVANTIVVEQASRNRLTAILLWVAVNVLLGIAGYYAFDLVK